MKILVIRFSALGDVALMVPAVLNLVKNNPDIKIHIASREKMRFLFENKPNIIFHGFDFDKRFKGFFGILRLYKYLRSLKPDIVFDMHDVLRTKVLGLFFKIWGTKVFTINKGRAEKKARIESKEKIALKHTIERYSEVFDKANLKTSKSLENNTLKINISEKVNVFLTKLKSKNLIGIAPFAAHQNKIWPVKKYASLLSKIHQEFPETQILFFGGGEKEKLQIDSIIQDSSFTHNIVGQFSMAEEMEIISVLKLMICMDSANMHLAALSKIPTISIWGPTHTDLGFGPIGTQNHHIIQIPTTELSCRPCSVFGNKPCSRGDHACMEGIDVEMVMEKIKVFLI